MDCITVEYGEICIQVIKLDVETKLQVEWSAENCWPSEPVFVPRPGASEEHDGELFGEAGMEESSNRNGLVVSFTDLFLSAYYV